MKEAEDIATRLANEGHGLTFIRDYLNKHFDEEHVFYSTKNSIYLAVENGRDILIIKRGNPR